MANKVNIKVRLVPDDTPFGNNFRMLLCDTKETTKKCIEKFLLDTGKTEILLEGVLMERIEYKSKGQLGYYFAVVVKCITAALIESGYKELNEKIVDDFLRGKFLTEAYFNEITGESIEFVKELKDLMKDEMADFLKKCIDFANQDLKTQIPTSDR